jgi:hypothetical protein
MPRSLEIFWNIIKNRRLVKGDIPFQNTILIGLAFGIIAYKYSEEQEAR